MITYGPPPTIQKLHLLSIFAQIANSQTSGCLRIKTNAASWLIYLKQGKLSFASSSTNPFDRLDRHLYQLRFEIPALVSNIRSHVRSLFEDSLDQDSLVPAEYLAIEWLLEQQYINRAQATLLIENIAKEVLESLLNVTEAEKELVECSDIHGFPSLCQFDLRSLVKSCQTQLRKQQPTPKPSVFLFQEPTISEPLHQYSTQIAAQTSPDREPDDIPDNASVLMKKEQYTIACIDDSPTILHAINTFLDVGNLAVIMINDPLKALIQITRSKPDLILLDIGMPNLDGYDLCAMLRRHPHLKSTPIVMVTGHTGFIDRAKAKMAGASGYLTKPFTRPELMKVVFKYLT